MKRKQTHLFILKDKSDDMEWLEIAAVVILVIIGIFIYRNKVNQN